MLIVKYFAYDSVLGKRNLEALYKISFKLIRRGGGFFFVKMPIFLMLRSFIVLSEFLVDTSFHGYCGAKLNSSYTGITSCADEHWNTVIV